MLWWEIMNENLMKQKVNPNNWIEVFDWFADATNHCHPDDIEYIRVEQTQEEIEMLNDLDFQHIL